MKTLIHNYSTQTSTEAMYFAKSLEIVEQPVQLWGDANISAFDMFDSAQPDVFITHFTYLTNDILKYISSSNKKISMALNITGASDRDISILEQAQESKKLDIPFVFSNIPDSISYPKSQKIKTVNIMPAADIFMPKSSVIDFSIDYAIIGTTMDDLVKQSCEGKEVYHLLCMGQDNEKNFDTTMSVTHLVSILDKYKEVILTGGVELILSQVMFEAALHSKKMSINTDKESQHILDKFLASIFHDEGEDKNLGEIIKGQVKRKHTCISRAARLCKFLKNEEAHSKLEKMREQLQ